MSSHGIYSYSPYLRCGVVPDRRLCRIVTSRLQRDVDSASLVRPHYLTLRWLSPQEVYRQLYRLAMVCAASLESFPWDFSLWITPPLFLADNTMDHGKWWRRPRSFLYYPSSHGLAFIDIVFADILSGSIVNQ